MYPSKSHSHFNSAGMVLIFLDRVSYLYFKLYLKRLFKLFFYLRRCLVKGPFQSSSEAPCSPPELHRSGLDPVKVMTHISAVVMGGLLISEKISV